MKKLTSFVALLLSAQTTMAAVPTLALTFNTDVQVYQASESQEVKIHKAAELIKQVVASEEFRLAVLNHTYNGVKKFVDNNGLTNLEIYHRFLDGVERLDPIKDNEMDLEIETYYEATNTVGYTYPSSSRIYMNTKYLSTYTAAQVSRNMTHEWLHKIGFGHASSYSVSRDYSVPYGIGSIMERLAAKAATSYLNSVSNLTLTSTASTVYLKWAAGSSSAGITEYKIYRVPEGSTTAYLQGTTTSLSFSRPVPVGDATYYIKTVADDGRTINSEEVSYVRFFLTAPTNLTLTKSTSNVTLKWRAANASEGLRYYRVYRQLEGSSSIYLQGTTTSLSFTQSRPLRNATYYIRAEDLEGNSVKSSEVKFFR